MALKTQQPPSQQRWDNDDTFISLQAGNNTSLDDLEFKERHGEQYHLRHHLSGCAQTLYTIDFNNDFVTLSATPSLSALLSTTAQPDMALGYVTATTAPLNLLVNGGAEVQQAILKPSLSVDSSNSSDSVVSIPHDLYAIETNDIKGNDAEHSNLPRLGTIHAEVETVHPAETSKQINTSYIADFNDGTLGGWSLQGELTADSVVENGKLHFSAENLHSDTPLLSQSMALKADQSYQFQMSVQADAGAEPPQLVLNINGENYAMNAVCDGDNFVLRVEFVAPQTEVVTLSIVPVGITPVMQDLWLDDLMVMPVAPSAPNIEMSVMLQEPIFDFTQLVIDPIATAEPTLSHLDLSMLLQDIHPSLFVDADAMQPEHLNSSNIDAMLDIAHYAEWNDIAEMPMVFIDNIHTEALEMSPNYN